MKHLLLLFLILLCNVCIAQKQKKYPDQTKVTAYRIVSEYNDGPCSVASYVAMDGIGYSVKAAETSDSKIAYRLAELKEEAKKKWPSRDHDCMKGWLGGRMVHNMFVIEINAYRDTVFTTEGNSSIFIPEEHREYLDESKAIEKVLNKELRRLFTTDFTAEIENFDSLIDSIAYNDISINNNTNLYNYTQKQFEKEIGAFIIIKTDSVFLGDEIEIDKEYYYQNCKLYFDRKNNKLLGVIAEDGSSNQYPLEINIRGISVGSDEEELAKAFPNSTRYKKGLKVGNLNDDYYYIVKLRDRKGEMSFNIKKRKVVTIEVSFDYDD